MIKSWGHLKLGFPLKLKDKIIDQKEKQTLWCVLNKDSA